MGASTIICGTPYFVALKCPIYLHCKCTLICVIDWTKGRVEMIFCWTFQVHSHSKRLHLSFCTIRSRTLHQWARGSPMINDEGARENLVPSPQPGSNRPWHKGSVCHLGVPLRVSPIRVGGSLLHQCFSFSFARHSRGRLDRPSFCSPPPGLPVYVKRPACTSLPQGKRGLAFLWSLCGWFYEAIKPRLKWCHMPNDPEWGQFQAQWVVCWCHLPPLAPSAKYRLTIDTSARRQNHMQILQEALKCMKGLSASNAHGRGICCAIQICIRKCCSWLRQACSSSWWYEQTWARSRDLGQ